FLFLRAELQRAEFRAMLFHVRNAAEVEQENAEDDQHDSDHKHGFHCKELSTGSLQAGSLRYFALHVDGSAFFARYLMTCTSSSVTSPSFTIVSRCGSSRLIFSSVSTISITMGRSIERRRIFAVCMWLLAPKPIGPRSTVAPARPSS